MSLNLDAIKAKLNQLNKQDDKKSQIWRPTEGKTRIRIVPYVHRKDNPFLELYFHYDFGKKTMLSPISFGNPDPIQEFADKLKKTGDKDDWVQGRKIEPKMRTYVPIIVRGKEEEGVKFWGFGKTIYSELLSIITDPDYGDITDLISGRDIDVEFTPAENANSYPKTAIRVKPSTTKATEDKEIAQKILNQPVITDIYPEPTYEELEDALKVWLEGGSETESEDEQEEESSTKSTSMKSSVTKTTNIDEAFSDLFND
jgi:hypothetical protein